ncbi:hypothetical protein D9M71_544170 [compost metagenome]
MAHIGEELGLDPAGLESLLARQTQLDVLHLDGFHGVAQVFGGLLDAQLQLLVGILQRLGHTVDAGGQFVQLAAGEGRQAGVQLTVADLRDAMADLLQRLVDRPAHAQGEQGAEHQPTQGQQQAGQQAAVALHQGALVGQLQFDPAEQAVVFVERRMAAELAVVAVDRQQEAGGADAADLGELVGQALGRLGAHARAGMGEEGTLRIQQAEGAHVGLL